MCVCVCLEMKQNKWSVGLCRFSFMFAVEWDVYVTHCVYNRELLIYIHHLKRGVDHFRNV